MSSMFAQLGVPIVAYTRVKSLRRAAGTRRWHTYPTQRTQDVGSHSHAVAMLVQEVEPKASKDLLLAALTHDLHEGTHGDIPSTAKWAEPTLEAAMDAAEQAWNKKQGFNFELDAHELRVLKFCDYFELMLWALEELRLGNQYMHEVVANIRTVIDLGQPTPRAVELYRAACHEYDTQIGVR